MSSSVPNVMSCRRVSLSTTELLAGAVRNSIVGARSSTNSATAVHGPSPRVLQSSFTSQIVSLDWNVQTAWVDVLHGPRTHLVKCQPATLTAVIEALQRRCAGMQFSK